MLKNVAKLEAKINERVHQYILDNDTPLNDIKDFCLSVLKYVGQIEDQVAANAKASNPEEAPKDCQECVQEEPINKE